MLPKNESNDCQIRCRCSKFPFDLYALYLELVCVFSTILVLLTASMKPTRMQLKCH